MNEELKIIIKAETEQLRDELQKGKKEVEDFGKDSEKNFDTFDDAVAKAKDACKTAMVGIAAAITGAVAAMTALAEETREFRNNQAKLTTAFETAGASAETATKVYDELYRVLGDDGQATEAAAHLAKLSNNQEELAEWTDIAKGVYAEFGDSLPIEGLTEAANETAKTGKLTGSLADALNWAGIKEDDFQESLDKCNTEAEREQKIRSTLIKTYKNSSTAYEKNNKNVLKANEAQNKLNKAMAKAGDTVEPVVADLKELGASLLEDMHEPMKDVADFLTNTLFPAIRNTIDWIMNNKEIVISAIVGVTTAVAAYKLAVLASKAAEEGLTAAMWLRHAAQKALNVIMAASPWGLVATLIGGVTAALITYNSITEESTSTTRELTEEEKALHEEIDNTTKSYRDREKAFKDEAGGILSQMEYVKGLSKELQTLADKNGKVKDADKTRVEFILGELNEALGTEYKMVGNVINQYGSLKSSIENVIATKEANLLLEANSENFTNALKEEQTLYEALIKSEDTYVKQKEESNPKIKKLEEEIEQLMKKRVDGLGMLTRRQLLDIAEEIEAKRDAVEDEKKLLNTLEQKYNEASANYLKNQTTINKHRAASEAALEGNTQKVKDLLTDKNLAFKKYSKNVDEEETKVLNTLQKAAIDAGIKAKNTKDNFEKGVKGYTKQMVKDAEKDYEDAMN